MIKLLKTELTVQKVLRLSPGNGSTVLGEAPVRKTYREGCVCVCVCVCVCFVHLILPNASINA